MSDKIVHFNPPELLPADVIGRNRLQEWLDSQPDNFFTADADIQRKLELYYGEDRYRELMPRFYKFGGTVAKDIDPLARSSNLDRNLPQLDRFDAIGQPLETVNYHPDYHAIGRLTYPSGVMSVLGEPGSNRHSLALFYLSAQNGEAGHNCPLACTAGVIKVLQYTASDTLRQKYLPHLLNSDYDRNYTGAQYFTEVQGGSDVGLNAVRATPEDSDDSSVWYLTGDKWFCSNVTADLALVTARVGTIAGTRGLGLFLVPRLLDDGRPNGYAIQRLKDKLGTRSLATAEVSFKDALAYRVGDFKDGMNYVINTSRVYNAFACAGNARRALTLAWTYAQNRIAFDKPIIRYPIVQAQLAAMRVDTAAILAGSMRIAKMMDDVELGKATADDRLFLRMAVNLNKYRSAVLAHGVINGAIELLGGNGAMESFSILPRLLRDNVVYENWEGSHNVILAQVLRDLHKYELHKPFFTTIRQLFQATQMSELKQIGLSQLEKLQEELPYILEMEEEIGAIYFRPYADRVTDLYYAACMAAESGWEHRVKEDKTKQRTAIFYLNRRLQGLQPGDIKYYDDQVSRLSSAI